MIYITQYRTYIRVYLVPDCFRVCVCGTKLQCKGKFMATQAGESMPFVEELLKQLHATVSDLETHQVRFFIFFWFPFLFFIFYCIRCVLFLFLLFILFLYFLHQRDDNVYARNMFLVPRFKAFFFLVCCTGMVIIHPWYVFIFTFKILCSVCIVQACSVLYLQQNTSCNCCFRRFFNAVVIFFGCSWFIVVQHHIPTIIYIVRAAHCLHIYIHT